MNRYDIKPWNDDFSTRVVENADAMGWLESDTPGVRVKMLEAAMDTYPRLTMLIRFAPGSSYDLRQHYGGEEFLVLEGSLQDERGKYPTGYYVRNPAGNVHVPYSESGCLLFVKLGEFAADDREQRIINVLDDADWLPGPVDNTEVLALHMHDTRSVLMLRWREDATFKPGLDPQGEEIFIINGQLTDNHGSYSEHTWIRNPIVEWQAWSGDKHTLVYYKNGHFPAHAE